MWSLVVFYLFFPIFVYNQKWQWISNDVKKRRKKVPYKTITEERLKKCDDVQVIIIGGNISGLVAGAALVKAGIRVMILEKSNKLGGSFRTEERSGYEFDINKSFSNLKKSKMILDWLCEEPLWWVKKDEPIIECKYQGKSFKIFNSQKQTKDYAKQTFINEQAQERFWSHVNKYSKSNKLIFEALKFYHMPQFIREMLQKLFAPNYIAYNQMSVEHMLDECNFDENCKFTNCLKCLADKKNSASEILDFIDRCEGGNFYLKNGINKLIYELCQTIKTKGSYIFTNASVESIDTKNCTVKINNGLTSTAAKIISSVSLYETFHLVGFGKPKLTLKSSKIRAFIALKKNSEIELKDKILNVDSTVYKIMYGTSKEKPCLIVEFDTEYTSLDVKIKETITNSILEVVGLKESLSLEWVHVELVSSKRMKNDINKFIKPCKPTTLFGRLYLTGRDIVHTQSLEDAVRAGYITANSITNYGTFFDILTGNELIKNV